MIKAVIDIGTNSTRLYVADVKDRQTQILKMLSTTRLGEGILSSDKMQEIPMTRTSDAVRDFVDIARKNNAEEIYIYATAVVRESSNKEDFSQMIFEKTGITLDIIPGELEGEIAFIGASQDFPSPAVIDIGGGSTEVVLKENGKLNALSLKTGGVRLKEQFMTESGIINVSPVKEFVLKNYIPEYEKQLNLSSVKTLIGVSGTPTTLISLSMGLKTYTPQKIQNGILTKDTLDNELQKLALMTSEERKIYSGDFAPRADIIVFGGCILSSFMEYYGFDKITVSDRDSLEGYMELKSKH